LGGGDINALMLMEAQNWCKLQWRRVSNELVLRNRAILTRFRSRFRLLILLHTLLAPVPYNLRKLLKIKFLLIFLMKLDGKQVDFNSKRLICSPTMVPFKTNVSKLYLTPFYTWNRSRKQDLEKDHVSGSNRGKMIRLRRFRFRLRNTATNCNTHALCSIRSAVEVARSNYGNLYTLVLFFLIIFYVPPHPFLKY
jgi:hypothetical protein